MLQNDLFQTPVDFCEQPKHIRGPHKNGYDSLGTRLENYIGAGTMDQWESIVQPKNQCGIKEGRQVIWQRTSIHRISSIQYVFTLTARKVAKTTAHKWLIFKVQKLVEALL
jgi:hypothetical protein